MVNLALRFIERVISRLEKNDILAIGYEYLALLFIGKSNVGVKFCAKRNFFLL
jgi:hypothetical protein